MTEWPVHAMFDHAINRCRCILFKLECVQNLGCRHKKLNQGNLASVWID